MAHGAEDISKDDVSRLGHGKRSLGELWRHLSIITIQFDTSKRQLCSGKSHETEEMCIAKLCWEDLERKRRCDYGWLWQTIEEQLKWVVEKQGKKKPLGIVETFSLSWQLSLIQARAEARWQIKMESEAWAIHLQKVLRRLWKEEENVWLWLIMETIVCLGELRQHSKIPKCKPETLEVVKQL